MKNRLLLELENLRKSINRETINPRVPNHLEIKDLSPLISMVAEARANYIEALLKLAETTQGKAPEPAQLNQLRQYREIFEELVTAVNALETVIQREYLDVRSDKKPAAF